MARINPVTQDQADPKARELLAGVEKSLGMVPNLMSTIAHSPASLAAYLGFGQALSGGSLGGKLREQIAVAVAGANSCEYCASAHTALGKMQGVDEVELARNLLGESEDDRTRSAIQFAKAIAQQRGWVSDDDYSAVRDAGFSEGEIVEIIATVAINTFTNYLNHIAETEVDFPRVEVAEPVTT